MSARGSRAGISLIEIVVAIALLLVLVGPMIHIYVITSRGMRGGEDELVATQLCLRVLEGFQALPVDEIPAEFALAPVGGLPPALLARMGWTEAPGYAVMVAVTTVRGEVPEDLLRTVAPDPEDPRREQLVRITECRAVRVTCMRDDRDGRGPPVRMSTLVGRTK